MLELFAHNRAAYDAAAKLLASVGKAAVIHPTGTGKSFIAFQLAADHPGENILWLSPSEYIFTTQRESLRRQAPEVSLDNVHFYTYAKLLRLTEDDLAAIADLRPAYIILDEYHRAGAQEWSAALQKLLAACPQAKLLGLSATNIRYLDNQRNMADELFDGNVASEMTLGEAIVRGILPAPKYVTTVFRYGRDLARYEYYILNVTLTNKTLPAVILPRLNEQQREIYTVMQQLKGNKPYLWEGIYTGGEDTGPSYEIPGEALDDPAFAALMAEATKYIGWPYVWGGSSPSTSFDCSGFVCWVYTASGVHNLPRTTAQGIYNQCAIISPSEAKPGDIIFFTGTYDSPGPVSHVGIYVGDGMMLHCGSPIQYANINSSYWQTHFYAFGRL